MNNNDNFLTYVLSHLFIFWDLLFRTFSLKYCKAILIKYSVVLLTDPGRFNFLKVSVTPVYRRGNLLQGYSLIAKISKHLPQLKTKISVVKY